MSCLDLRNSDLFGEQTQTRAGFGRRSNTQKRLFDALTDRGRIMIAISTREGNQHVVTGHGQTTSRTSLWDLAADLTTELRIRRITHTQLHTGAEDVLHLDTEVHLAQRSGNEVNTERQRAFGH